MWSFLGIALSAVLTLVSLVLTRRAAAEASRREMRNQSYEFIRWAAELALAAPVQHQRAGLQVLEALARSPTVDQADVELTYAITRAVTGQLDIIRV